MLAFLGLGVLLSFNFNRLFFVVGGVGWRATTQAVLLPAWFRLFCIFSRFP
jgi:hypothetical protein